MLRFFRKLIGIPSVSGDESGTANLITEFINSHSVKAERIHNNIIVKNKAFDPSLSTVLLNTHHDTVKPVDSWKRDPYDGAIENERIYGLGSNDAGASLISLLHVFLELTDLMRSILNL